MIRNDASHRRRRLIQKIFVTFVTFKSFVIKYVVSYVIFVGSVFFIL